jgi:PTH2 family peptidyl-tRNA hydrolase
MDWRTVERVATAQLFTPRRGNDLTSRGDPGFVAPKLVVCVRTDLGMGKGKIAAQVGHASVKAAEAARRQDQSTSKAWKDAGQPKVVVTVTGSGELDEIRREARAANLPTQTVTDAGRTQLEPGTTTCLAVGPADAGKIDPITGHLSLL